MTKRKAKLSVIQPEPLADDIIERLEELLGLAKSGEISSFACAIVCRDGETGNVCSHMPNKSVAIGAIERMKFRIMMKDFE